MWDFWSYSGVVAPFLRVANSSAVRKTRQDHPIYKQTVGSSQLRRINTQRAPLLLFPPLPLPPPSLLPLQLVVKTQ